MVWPFATLVLSRLKSPLPCPTLPCMMQVVPSLVAWELKIRKCPAVPAALAFPDHVPSLVLDPPEAAFIQSDGRLMSQRSDPALACVQSAGCVVVRICIEHVVPPVDSIVSRRAFRMVSFSWIAPNWLFKIF